MEKIVLIKFLAWYFIDSPKNILKAWGNFLFFILNYFSIPVLIKTYFSHWRKYRSLYQKGFAPWLWFEAFVFNMFSRIIGAILRSVFIVLGLIIEIAVFLAGLAILLVWIFLPVILFFVFVFGLRLIIFAWQVGTY